MPKIKNDNVFYVYNENETWIFSYEYYSFMIDKVTATCNIYYKSNNELIKSFKNVFIKF